MNWKMGIPEIRDCMYAISRELISHEDHRMQDLGFILHELAIHTKRRPAVTRAPTGCSPVTEKIRRAVVAVHHLQPELRMDQIGDMFNINQGRVSEILHPK